MRSLGRLVRGLSALFWGLPAALVVCVYTARTDSLKSFALALPLVCTGLLVYGLWQIGAFQKQERVWRNALDCARLLSLVNFGLSPFLFFWNKIPNHPFFLAMVVLMQIAALLFLGSLNVVLRRLGAMLPDEALRLDIKQFTTLNLNLLGATFLLGLATFLVGHSPHVSLYLQSRQLPLYIQRVVALLDSGTLWFPLPLLLLPLAMTMALLWKTKEVILDNVFGPKPPEA
jgi:hypothetical protein